MSFDFDSATRRKLGYKLIDHIDAYYSSLPDRPVQLPANQRTYGPLDNPVPEDSADPLKVLDEICRDMVDQGFHVPDLHGLSGRSPGSRAESSTRNIGAVAAGVED